VLAVVPAEVVLLLVLEPTLGSIVSPVRVSVVAVSSPEQATRPRVKRVKPVAAVRVRGRAMRI